MTSKEYDVIIVGGSYVFRKGTKKSVGYRQWETL
ncbi:hypothetical protein POKO110462_02385 [Pontibacter korlensis]